MYKINKISKIKGKNKMEKEKLEQIQELHNEPLHVVVNRNKSSLSHIREDTTLLYELFKENIGKLADVHGVINAIGDALYKEGSVRKKAREFLGNWGKQHGYSGVPQLVVKSHAPGDITDVFVLTPEFNHMYVGRF